MANELTEHSRQLRVKTAAAWNKQKRASGEIRQMNIHGKAEILDDFDQLVKALGGKRPQVLKILCDFYREHHTLPE